MLGINMDKAGIIMDDKFITLAHGAGGLKSRELVEEINTYPAFNNEYLRQMHDGAKLHMSNNIAFTTDSYVLPWKMADSQQFFPPLSGYFSHTYHLSV